MFRIVVFLFFVAITIVCGDATSRIVGGNDSSSSGHPYQVSIRHKTCSTCPFTHRCGGVIYNERILITSANCVSGVNVKLLVVVAGSDSITATAGIIIPIESYIVHEDYESFYIDYDIAIVKLALDLPFGGKQIAPIQLATKLPADGSTAIVTGWGSLKEGGEFSNNLKVTRVKTVSDAECKKSYGATRITNSMLCAGAINGAADSCKGDSGGPLVVDGDLVGIVSWGRGCGRPGYPGVYANVVALTDWIIKTVGGIY